MSSVFTVVPARLFGLVVLLAFIAVAEARQSVDILYTGCTNGQIENCRCPLDPLGAMEKRAYEINRRRELGDVVLFDSGDFMPDTADKLKAGTIIEIMAYMNYDAVGLGDQELLQGNDMVRAMAEKLPLVSANLFYADGNTIAPPFRVIRRSGRTFAVTAVLDPSAFNRLEESVRNRFRLIDVDKALAAVLKDVPEDAEVIVLSHSGLKQDHLYAARWQEVDLIIGGHSGTLLEGVDTAAGIPIVQAGERGRYLGVARLRGGRVRAEVVPIRPQLPDDQRIIELNLKLKSAQKKEKGK